MHVFSPENMETRRAPSEWFTGDVWQEFANVPRPGARLLRVLFEPGARTNWHTHPEGQFLYVVTGEGRAARESGGVEQISAGDLVYFPPDEKHWHGAGPDTYMVHMAINPALTSDGGTEWLEPVTDEEYSA